MLDRKRLDRFGRIFVSFLAILLILFGLLQLFKGDVNYNNYWGGIVFAPIAIVVGILMLYIILFKWKAVNKNKNAFKYNSKMDDFKKW